jgi:hypothetical protein
MVALNRSVSNHRSDVIWQMVGTRRWRGWVGACANGFPVVFLPSSFVQEAALPVLAARFRVEFLRLLVIDFIIYRVSWDTRAMVQTMLAPRTKSTDARLSEMRRTSRWTGAAGACFASSLVRRRLREIAPPVSDVRRQNNHMGYNLSSPNGILEPCDLKDLHRWFEKELCADSELCRASGPRNGGKPSRCIRLLG